MPAKPSVKKPRSAPRSRSEVQRELVDITSGLEASETMDPKAAMLESTRRNEIRAAVKDISVEGIVQHIGTMGVDIARALSHVHEDLVQKVTELQNVRDAVTFEKEELERLHKIDTVKTAKRKSIRIRSNRNAPMQKTNSREECSFNNVRSKKKNTR